MAALGTYALGKERKGPVRSCGKAWCYTCEHPKDWRCPHHSMSARARRRAEQRAKDAVR